MVSAQKQTYVTLWVLAVLLTLSPVRSSLAKDYLIEAVVFSQPNDGSANELWNNDTSLKKERSDDVTPPRSRAARPAYFNPALLTNAAAAINRQDGYKVLSHVAWRQSGAARVDSPIIRLPLGNTSADLEGWMRVYLNTYIFAEFDLTLNNDQIGFNASSRASNSDASNASTTSNSSTWNEITNAPFKLKERRRVKFREIHYFDHPRLGIILTVQPAQTSG